MLHPQAFPWEAVLAAFFLLLIYAVYRLVRRRQAFARVSADIELPDLRTQNRIRGRLARIYRDPRQGVWLADLTAGSLNLTFCATDHEKNAASYRQRVGEEIEVAVYGLATLSAGGVEALPDPIRERIGERASADSVALIRTGQFANDHIAIGRVREDRDDRWGEMSLTVYSVEIAGSAGDTHGVDLAVQADPTQDRFPAGGYVYGSARLFGYLS